MGDLVKLIVDEIEGWDDGHQFRARYANDGGGHLDFMGLKVKEAGVEALKLILERTKSEAI